MFRPVIIVALVCSAFVISCEKCKKCSFTYTTTEIVQTINGEEEVVTTHTGYVYTNDTTIFDSECINSRDLKKGTDQFTIENEYKMKGDTTVLENYEYTCTDY
jgi:hypothetical protein